MGSQCPEKSLFFPFLIFLVYFIGSGTIWYHWSTMHAVDYHRCLVIIQEVHLVESFVGLLQILMILWRNADSLGRLATIFSLCNPGAGAATKWRKSKTSTARGYEKSPNSISNLIRCRQNVFGCDGASKGCQRARNLVPQSKNRGQIFANWNHYVRLLGERPDSLSSLSKLCVIVVQIMCSSEQRRKVLWNFG